MIDVTCAIILWQNKILATQRSEKMSLPMKWEFPGGKIEENETPESCLLREVREELNIDIEIIHKMQPQRFEYDTFSINLIPYVSKYLAGKIILAEQKDFKWLKKEELRNLDWAAADIPVLEEFVKLKYD